jgi:hypothetical protein
MADSDYPPPPPLPQAFQERLDQLDLVDEVHLIRNFVDCASMAAMRVEEIDESGAIRAVLDHASTQLRGLGERLRPPPWEDEATPIEI